MISMRRITCTNITDDVSVTFGDRFSPFLLQDVEGIYSIDVNINSTDNSMFDGSTIIGTFIRPRNIVLTIADRENYGKHRNLIYLLFKPKTKGVFVYEEVDEDFNEKREIEYCVEKIEQDSTGHVRQIVVSLLCADPFFRAIEDTLVTMSGWESMFEFPHYYIKEGEELAVRVTKQLVEIQNDSSADGIGLTITMTTNQPVINPRMYHVESDSFIQLGDDNNEFNMQIGDQVIFTTENNNKNAYLIRDGVKTIINEHISDDSEYIQLTHGTNHLRYSAKEGEEHLLVNVTFRMKYQGV